ncbi:MAG: DUF3592 domain-containing protein [Candidatus Obscuribacterales bacterium]|nr:DUF3592 domain-containing protein [Candidatus Obscuribacterales bacterium]
MKIQIVILFLAGLGLIFGSVSYFTFTCSRSLVEGGKAAEGTVTDLVHSKAYTPVVRFQTESGETIEGQSQFGSNPPQFKVQDKVRVFYKESNPKEWTIDSWWDLYFLPVMFGAFSGALFLAAAITAAVSSRGAKALNYTSYSQQRL